MYTLYFYGKCRITTTYQNKTAIKHIFSSITVNMWILLYNYNNWFFFNYVKRLTSLKQLNNKFFSTSKRFKNYAFKLCKKTHCFKSSNTSFASVNRKLICFSKEVSFFIWFFTHIEVGWHRLFSFNFVLCL